MSFIPPSLRRIVTTSPVVFFPTLACLLLFIIVLLRPAEPGTFSLLPSEWNRPKPNTWTPTPPPPTAGFPVLEDSPLALDPLPKVYAQYFPTLALPVEFDSSVYKPLGKRLHAFLMRPNPPQAEALKASESGCPLEISDRIAPLQDEGNWWGEIHQEQVYERRAQIVQWLASWIARGDAVVHGPEGGRGIVMTGGNQDTTLRMITTLRHLKRLKVQLPIEVFHYEDELHDRAQRREIERLGAMIRLVKGVHKQDNAWKNWQIKGLALVQSSFREILYLDSDNIPLRDPTHLFDAPLYVNSGRAVYWPDLSKDHPHNAIWRILGKPCNLDSWTFESAQIVVDKAGNGGMNLAALIVAAEMQGERDFWFHMCGGDKDTFRWAFEMLGLKYGESPRWMSSTGIMNQYEGGRFCGHTVLQHDLVIPEGFTREPPLFIHSNLLKHIGGSGLHRGNLFTHVKRMKDDIASLASLNYAHQWVYMGKNRGMCLDLEWSDTALPALGIEEIDRAGIETIALDGLEGDIMKGFEDTFFEEGGKIGGW